MNFLDFANMKPSDLVFVALAALLIIFILSMVIATKVRNRKDSKAIEEAKQQNNESDNAVNKEEAKVNKASKQIEAKELSDSDIEKIKATIDEVVENGDSTETKVVTVTELMPTENKNVKETVSLVRYRKSFLAQLILRPELKDIYAEIRNFILSYKKVHARMSFRCESFTFGRKNLLKMFVRGKRIYIYYALNPNELDSKYHIIDVSEKKIGEKLPTLHKVLSQRSVKYAKELIEVLMANEEIEKLSEDKILNYDYEELLMPRSIEQLLEEGLVVEYRVKQTRNVLVYGTKSEEDDDDEDDDDSLEASASDADLMVDDEDLRDLVNYKKLNRSGKMAIINVDTLSHEFEEGDLVNLEALIKKHLVPKSTKRIKVLARGSLDKALMVEADDFSKDAMKMIIFTEGSVTVL